MSASREATAEVWSRAFELLRGLDHLEGNALTEQALARCKDDRELRAAVASLIDGHEADSNGITPELDTELGLGPIAVAHTLPEVQGIELTRLLGQGGSGDVYAGRQLSPARDVAVKVLRSGLTSRRAVDRFAREGRALAAIQHPAVATIHAIAEARLANNAIAPCLVMEYVHGRTLSDADKPMPVQQAAAIAAQIARGLHAAHQRGVVHRDLKPSNVIIDADGNPRIIDFGIAALHSSGASTMHTLTGELLGTLGYMSPEQIDGTSDVADVRIDVYAVGVVFYELLTGTPAVDPTTSSSFAAIQAIVNGALPRLPSGGDADAVYRKATAAEASRRYDSAAALADDLERLAQGRPVTARPPSLGYTASRFARRHPWTTAFAAAAAAAVIGLSAAVVAGFMTASRERDAAIVAQARAAEASEFLRGMLASPDPDVDGPGVRVVDILDRSAREIDRLHADDPLVAMDLHRTIGWTYASLSEHDDAVAHLERATELAARHLDETDSQRLELETTLADSLVYVGRFQEAVELTESILDRCRAEETTPVSVYAAALVSHGEALRNVGRLDESMDALHQAREVTFAAPATSDAQYRAALSGLGRSYLDQTLAAEARQVFERLLTLFPPEDVGVASGWFIARGNLAIALASEGRHAEAIPIYEDILSTGGERLGDSHYTLRMVRGILPDSYMAVGMPDEALATSERSLSDAARIYGQGHPDELLAVSNHAVLLMQLGRSDAALQHTARLFNELPAALGPDHPRTLVGLRNHAAALDNVGRDEESADVLRRVLAIQQSSLGDGHFDTLVTKNNLAFLLEAIGESAEAASLMQSVVDHSGPESGLPDPARGIFQLNLGRSLISIGALDRARAALDASLELFPDNEAHAAKVGEALARLESLGDGEPAAQEPEPGDAR